MLDSIAMFESPWQWAIVLAIVLILFGGGRIKELMGGLGAGMREFKKGVQGDEDDKAARSDGKAAADSKDSDKEAANRP